MLGRDPPDEPSDESFGSFHDMPGHSSLSRSSRVPPPALPQSALPPSTSRQSALLPSRAGKSFLALDVE
jgi:hypothetical protein